jgi:hypothetical protein
MTRDRHQQHQDAVRVYKGQTVFDWDHEPSDERPSAFVESTQYGQLWAPSTRAPGAGLEVARARPPRKQGGIGAGWIALIIGLAVAAGAVIGYTKSKQARRADLATAATRVAMATL